ncbi:hypothetical protein KIW84_014626, partial [Lathyrus oleraceus]
MNPLRLIATALCCVAIVFGGLTFPSNAQLNPFFYSQTCPQLHYIVYQILFKVAKTDPRMPASLIRLHFHDCFVQTGGPGWLVPLGRRDSLTANQTLANQNLPGPSFSLTELKSAFADQGLTTLDLVSLSGMSIQI